MANPLKVYVVEDDIMHGEMVKDHLSAKGYTVKVYSTGEQLLKEISTDTPDILLLDYNLNSVDKNAMEGIDILKRVKDKIPDLEVVMYSGQDSIDVAVDTMRYGAFDYVVKGEAAFTRIDFVIGKIRKNWELLANEKRFRKMSTWLIALVAALVGSIIVGVITGYIDISS
jgi:DNA-binding NtrC family response regulator